MGTADLSEEEWAVLLRLYRIRCIPDGRLVVPLRPGRKAFVTDPLIISLLLIFLPLLLLPLAGYPLTSCLAGPALLLTYWMTLFLLLRVRRTLVLAPGIPIATLRQAGTECSLPSAQLDAYSSVMAGRPCLWIGGGRFFVPRSFFTRRATHEAALPLLSRIVESSFPAPEESLLSRYVSWSDPCYWPSTTTAEATSSKVNLPDEIGTFFSMFEVAAFTSQGISFRVPAHEERNPWPGLLCLVISLPVALSGVLGLVDNPPQTHWAVAYLICLCVLPFLYAFFFRLITPCVFVEKGKGVVVKSLGRVYRADTSQCEFDLSHSCATESAPDLEIVLKCGTRRFALWVGTDYDERELRQIVDKMNNYVASS